MAGNLPRLHIPQVASFIEPTPLARAVDVDITNRNWSDRQELPNSPSSRRTSPETFSPTRDTRTPYAVDATGGGLW
jgi:hypothetical protein